MSAVCQNDSKLVESCYDPFGMRHLQIRQLFVDYALQNSHFIVLIPVLKIANLFIFTDELYPV